MKSTYYPTFGETLDVQEVAGFVVSETIYGLGVAIPRHVHEDDGYFNLVLKGGYKEFSGRKTEEFTAPTLLFHPPGVTHANKFHAKNSRLFHVRFSATWLSRLRDHVRLPDTSALFEFGWANQLATRVYAEFKSCDEVAPLTMEGLILEMLAETSRTTSRNGNAGRPRWLQLAVELLHDKFNTSLTVAEIAAVVGIHPVHLSRTFRLHFHCTAGEYIQKLRIEFAARRLSTTKDSLAQIASEAGFSDQPHFSRTFKRLTRTTPAAYRKFFK